MMLDKSVIWDHNIVQIRLFQAEVAKCLQETVAGKTYTRMVNMMIKDYAWLENYITQYLDVLNVRYLGMDKAKRLKNLSIMAKRLTEKGDEYRSIERTILEAAKDYNRSNSTPNENNSFANNTSSAGSPTVSERNVAHTTHQYSQDFIPGSKFSLDDSKTGKMRYVYDS